MKMQEFVDRSNALVRRIDGDEGYTIVADFGGGQTASVDVIDATAIVTIDGLEHDDTYDLDLPTNDARAFMKNGVLTIEVNE